MRAASRSPAATTSQSPAWSLAAAASTAPLPAGARLPEESAVRPGEHLHERRAGAEGGERGRSQAGVRNGYGRSTASAADAPSTSSGPPARRGPRPSSAEMAAGRRSGAPRRRARVGGHRRAAQRPHGDGERLDRSEVLGDAPGTAHYRSGTGSRVPVLERRTDRARQETKPAHQGVVHLVVAHPLWLSSAAEAEARRAAAGRPSISNVQAAATALERDAPRSRGGRPAAGRRTPESTSPAECRRQADEDVEVDPRSPSVVTKLTLAHDAGAVAPREPLAGTRDRVARI